MTFFFGVNNEQGILMHCRFLSSRKGVTFPEVIISIGILGFALTALLNGMVAVINLNKVSRNTTMALSHAEYVLESIRSTPYTDVVFAVDSGRWTLQGGKIAEEGLAPLKNEMIVTSRDGFGPLVINVVVQWEDAGGRQRSIDLSTIEAGI